jgi:hypothetical protein
MLDRRGDKLQHHVPIMLNRLAVATRSAVDAKIDSEASAQTCNAAGHAALCEDAIHSLEQPRANGLQVIVETRLAICSDGRQRRSDHDRVRVVCAAVLTIALGHQPLHDIRATAEDTQRIPAANGLAQRTQVGRHAEILLRSAGSHPES